MWALPGVLQSREGGSKVSTALLLALLVPRCAPGAQEVQDVAWQTVPKLPHRKLRRSSRKGASKQCQPGAFHARRRLDDHELIDPPLSLGLGRESMNRVD